MDAQEILDIVNAFFQAIVKVFTALKALFGTVSNDADAADKE